jgi:hypothetical protein
LFVFCFSDGSCKVCPDWTWICDPPASTSGADGITCVHCQAWCRSHSPHRSEYIRKMSGQYWTKPSGRGIRWPLKFLVVQHLRNSEWLHYILMNDSPVIQR